MKSRTAFKDQQLGFFFNINNLQVTPGEDIPESQYSAAEAVNTKAYELIQKLLPQAGVWRKQDENEPEITYSPYEVCEETWETEELEGKIAFSFWIFSHHPIDQATMSAFQVEVATAYELAAAELGGNVQFLRIESVVKEEIVTRTVIGTA